MAPEEVVKLLAALAKMREVGGELGEVRLKLRELLYSKVELPWIDFGQGLLEAFEVEGDWVIDISWLDEQALLSPQHFFYPRVRVKRVVVGADTVLLDKVEDAEIERLPVIFRFDAERKVAIINVIDAIILALLGEGFWEKAVEELERQRVKAERALEAVKAVTACLKVLTA